MTAVVGTLLKAWGVPRMNVRCVRSFALEGNASSLRVFEKNGFVPRETVVDCVRMVTKDEYTGRVHTVHVVEWKCQGGDEAFPR